jgi:hypothetical protein
VVGVDRYRRIIEVDRRANTAFADIRQRTKEWTTRQEALLVELFVNPVEETIDDRLGLFLPTCLLCLPRQTFVANLLLDLVKNCDRLERPM